jgi:hypothetical protein
MDYTEIFVYGIREKFVQRADYTRKWLEKGFVNRQLLEDGLIDSNRLIDIVVEGIRNFRRTGDRNGRRRNYIE